MAANNAAMLRELAIQAAVSHSRQADTASMLRELAIRAAVSQSVPRDSGGGQLGTSFISSGFSSKAAWLAAKQRAEASPQPDSPPEHEVASSIPAREPQSTPHWSEVFLNVAEAGACHNAGQSVARGHSVLVVSNIASVAECAALLAGAQDFQDIPEIDGPKQLDTCRIPVAGLGPDSQYLCNEVLLRALDLVDGEHSALSSAVFGEPLAATLRSQATRCVDSRGLEFNKNEPAINICLCPRSTSSNPGRRTYLRPICDLA